MSAEPYYRHSGQVPPLALVSGLGRGLAAAVLLAFVYAYFIVYVPVVGVVTFILTAGFGALVGGAVGSGLHAGKARSLGWTTAIAAPVALFALWASWVVWVYALLHQADTPIDLIDLASSPEGLFGVILLINAEGAWSLGGATPTGGLLWVLWGAEAVLIVGFVVFVARTMVRSPFCEACDRWCEEHAAIALLGATTREALAPRLERGELGVLKELGGPSPLSYTQLDLHQCGQCQSTSTLTAKAVHITLKKGKQDKSETTLVEHLLVAPGDLHSMRALLAEVPSDGG